MNVGTARSILFALCLPLAGIGAFAQSASATVAPVAKPAAVSPKFIANYGKLPLSFEPNVGQTSTQVQWLARGPEYTLFLAGNDAVLELNKITPAKHGTASPEDLAPSVSSSVVRMSLLGANPSKSGAGEDSQSGKANYFTGNDPAKWQHDVPMYGKVRMQGVYPGIDLAYYGHQGQLEYDFVVVPGADASAIRLRFDGAKASLGPDGDLQLPVEGGAELRFNKPVVYQMMNGVRQPVDGSFMIAKDRQVSFRLGAYDHSRELVIDPTLLFIGVLGTGNYETEAVGMAVDASGEIILTGETSDVNFPVTTGAFQTVCNTDSAVAAANNYVRCGGASEGYLGSAFVTKISADGTSLVYSTYLHGLSGSEIGQAVAVDAAGDAVILGQTGSSDFPITANAFQSLCMPYYQPIGVLGGNPSDFYPVAQHCDGYFAGGGTEWVSGGPTIFISKLDPTGATLLYSTFFGGTNTTYPNSLALDSSGNIYFTSYLQGAEEYLSNNVPVSNVYPQNGTVPFPVTTSAFQSANLAQSVATLSELSADGQTLLYSTLFGAMDGPNPVWIQPLSLAVGPNGIAYVGGWTYSDSVPTTPGAVRPACVDSSVYNNGNETGNCEGYTGWLVAFDTTQSGTASLKYATYIGAPEAPVGNPQTQVWGLAADSENNVYVTGLTNRPNYPTTTGAFSSTCTIAGVSSGFSYCNNTAFLSKIDPTGSTYVWSTYFGGNNQSQSQGQAIAFDATGKVYLYGYDNNYTYDIPLVNPLEPRPGNGSSYAFVATFSSDGTQLLFSSPLGNQSPSAANVYPVQNNGIALDAAGNIYFAAYGADSGSFVPSAGTYATTALGGSNRTYFGKISPVLALNTTTLTIAPSTAATGQNVTFTATVTGTSQTTPTPTGTVTLTNINATPPAVLGTITLVNGTGTFNTSSLPTGTYSVTASYSGDTTYDVSVSAAMPLTVLQFQSINFNSIPNLTYGVGPITLTGVASSGLSVSYTVMGPATVLGTTLSITGIGAVTVTALQTGNAIYAAAMPVPQSFTVFPAVLTVAANDASKVYGAANPAFTYTITGFVDGDPSSVVSGTATLTETTTATSTSPVGAYPITFSTESLTALNYTFSYLNGTLTVYNTSQPLVLWLSPGSATVDEVGFTQLAVYGANFGPKSVVLWNGAVRATAFVSGTQLTATILASDIAAEGTNLVTVANPSPSAATSSAQPFAVQSSTPVAAITGASLDVALDGSGDYLMTLTGTDFLPGSVVVWNKLGLPTMYVSPWQISAQVSPSDIESLPVVVTVNDPSGPSGGFEAE